MPTVTDLSRLGVAGRRPTDPTNNLLSAPADDRIAIALFRVSGEPASSSKSPGGNEATGPVPQHTIVINVASLGVAGFLIQGDNADDFAGYSVSSAGDINGDGFGDVIVGAFNAGPLGNGRTYIVLGKASGFSTVDLSLLGTEEGWIIQGDSANDQFGLSVSSAGDVNGDGFDDFIVGAPGGDKLGAAGDAGEAWVIFGKASGFNMIDVLNPLGSGGFKIRGAAFGDLVGGSVSAGDINNDGFDDIIIGAVGGDTGGTDAGQIHVIFGKASGFADIDLANLGAAGFLIQGDAAQDGAGVSVASGGDFNGDGFDDLIIGASSGDDGGLSAGEAYLVFGKASGFGAIDLSSLGAAGFIVRGDAAGDFAGGSVAFAGDVNGDGFDDLIVGAAGGDDGGTSAGEAYVIFGKASGFDTIDLADPLGTAGFVIQGDEMNDSAGGSVATAGDINGDGFDDLIVGATGGGVGGTPAGAAYVIFGKASGHGSIDLSNLSDSQGFIIQGEGLLDQTGISVSAAGDVNNDGFGDLIVGAHANDRGGNAAGAAWVIFGLVPTSAVNRTGSVAGQTIRGGAFGDTLDGREGNDILYGGGGQDLLIGGTGADVTYGGAGEDVHYVDNAGDVVVELAGEGDADYVVASVSYVLGAAAAVERLQTPDEIDTPNIDLTGNGFANIITGNNGNNVLRGGGGNDELYGFGGDDLLVGGAGDDRINGGGGADTASYEDAAAGVTVSLAIAGIQNTIGAGSDRLELILHLTGSALDDTLTGSAGANILSGGGGNDTLIGGANSDTLIGGAGNDSYRVEEAGDQVIEAVGGGFDSVYTLVSYTLAANREVEALLALDPNGTAALVLTGNEFDNFIFGNAGSNTLIGGAGSDTLLGGGGNDFYRVEDSGDKITELVGGGIDSVYAVGNYTLIAGAEVELLSAIDPNNTVSMTLVGNEFDNFVIGNNGVNTLIGGAGSDTLIGNGGNDFYRVEDSGDKISEAVGGGFDSAYAVGNYTLAAGAEVEVLSAIDPANQVSMTLIGNEFDNFIIGNNGVNTLIGGSGSDTLIGNGGNDFYRVEDSGDKITETAGGGFDSAYAVGNYTLQAGAEVELLSAIDPGNSVAMNLTGNGFANRLIGNNGANVLTGGGGLDHYTGGGGADTFVLSASPGAANVVTIADMVSGTDKIALDDAVFAGIGSPGAFNAAAFTTGSAATNAAHRIIYDSTTGALLYDADGNGAGAAVQFATLATGLTLAASDFLVI